MAIIPCLQLVSELPCTGPASSKEASPVQENTRHAPKERKEKKKENISMASDQKGVSKVAINPNQVVWHT